MPIVPIPTQSVSPSTVAPGTLIAVDTLPGVQGVAQYVKLLDGSPAGVTPIGAGPNGMYVEVKAAPTLTVQPLGGAFAVTGGGGTQYTDGQAGVAVATGTEIMWMSGTVVRATSAANPLPIQAGSGVTLPVSIAAPVNAAITSPALGPAPMAASLPVVIATNQTAIPVAGNTTAGLAPSANLVVTVQGHGSGVPLLSTLSDGVIPTQRATVLPGGSGRSPLVVTLVDTAGGVVSVGGGTQYAGGAALTLAAIGNVLIWDDGGVARATSALKPLPVTPGPADNATFAFGTTPLSPSGYVVDTTALTLPPGGGHLAAARINSDRAQIMVIEDYAFPGAANQVTVSSRHAMAIEGVAGGTAVPVSGTVAVTGTFWQTTQPVGGAGAHNAALVGNPVNLGAQVAPTTAVDNAAATQALLTQLIADPVGKLLVLPYAAPSMMVSGATAAMTGVASVAVLAPAPASHRNYITQITVTNSSATVGTDILIQDGNAGITLYVIPAAAVYGGAVISFPVPLRQPTAGVGIYAQNTITGASTRVSASGYVGR